MAGNRDRRIDRLLPTLSAQERAIFVLRQYKAGGEPTAAIHNTMPSHQVAAFNRYIRLMNAVNCDLGAALHVLHAQLKQVDIKYAWLLSLVFLGGQIEDAGYGLLRETKDPKLRRTIKHLVATAPGALKRPIVLDVEPDRKEPFAVGLARALVAGIRDGLHGHWRELRAIEIALDEVAEEFDGEDPLQAEVRALLDSCLVSCRELRDEMADYVEIELPEPSEDDVAQVRMLIEKVVEKG